MNKERDLWLLYKKKKNKNNKDYNIDNKFQIILKFKIRELIM